MLLAVMEETLLVTMFSCIFSVKTLLSVNVAFIFVDMLFMADLELTLTSYDTLHDEAPSCRRWRVGSLIAAMLMMSAAGTRSTAATESRNDCTIKGSWLNCAAVKPLSAMVCVTAYFTNVVGPVPVVVQRLVVVLVPAGEGEVVVLALHTVPSSVVPVPQVIAGATQDVLPTEDAVPEGHATQLLFLPFSVAKVEDGHNLHWTAPTISLNSPGLHGKHEP